MRRMQGSLLTAKLRLRRLGTYQFLVGWGRRLSRTLRRLVVEIARKCTSGIVSLGPPNGFYSLDQLLQPEVGTEGAQVLQDQGSPETNSASLMVLCGLAQHQRQPWPIVWARQSQMRLCGPSLALLNERKQLAIESVYGAEFGRHDPAYSYFLRGTPTCLEGNWTSLVSRWVPNNAPTNYAHWLLDALPRLALLERFPPDTKIIVPECLQPFQEDSLTLLGLRDRCRPSPETYLQVDEYYFSAPPSMVVCYSPYSVQFLRTHLLPKATISSTMPKRFFLTRTGKFRSLINGHEVEAFFLDIGWELVDTGALHLEEQIALFRDAEAIVAIHGAGVANIVWASPTCKVLELVAENYLNGCYEWIAAVLRLEYQFQVCRADSEMNSHVDLVRLKQALTEWGVV